MRSLACVTLFLAFAASLSAQAVRFDSVASTTSAQCASGKICPINALPGTTVNVCGGASLGTVNTSGTAVTWVSGVVFGLSWTGTINIGGLPYTIATVNSTTSITLRSTAGTQTAVTYSNLSSCLASPATSYTDASAGTACSTTSQLTPATGGACLSTADNQGGFGAWLLPGSYSYYLRVPATAGGGTYGPYPLEIGASSGCPLGTTCDANYNTLAAACTAAGSGMLWVTRAWNGLTTQTLDCPMNFTGNGKLKPASAQTVTITNQVTAALSQIFDISAGGTIAISVAQKALYPQWWGALGNASHDDTVAIQAAVDVACQLGTGCITPVVFPGGTYKTTSQLNFYNGNSGYNSLVFNGSGAFKSIIDFQGPSSDSAIRLVGKFASLRDFGIQNNGASGWVAGLNYDGIPSHAISTKGEFYGIYINCNNKPGDGVNAGRSNYQADQATFYGLYVDNCLTSSGGVGFNVLDSNTVGIGLVNPTIAHSWLGAKTATSSQLAIFGGEIDENNVNFYPGIGYSFAAYGFRTENALRQLWTASGTAPCNVTISASSFANFTEARTATNATGTSGSGEITLSAYGLTGFTFGDTVTFASGPTGSYKIVGMTDPTHATVTPNLNSDASAVLISLDSGSQQNQFETRCAGPFTFSGNTINIGHDGGPAYFAAPSSSPNAAITISGNGWVGATSEPFGAVAVPASAYVSGNTQDSGVSSARMDDYYAGNLVKSGTFTPAVTFGGASVGVAYATQAGTYYTSPDGTITAIINIQLSSKGSSTGSARISGLPFTSTKDSSGTLIIVDNGSSISKPFSYVSAGETLVKCLDQGSVGNSFLADTNFTNTTELNVTITYR